MRYIVVGTSGSGKSTFARALAQAMRVRHIELDELYWGEHWTPRPIDEFTRAVSELAQGERWVMDGNYSAVREVLWPRATHVVWLNFSRPVVFWRVFWRTVTRAVLRQELWHGNRESVRRAFFSRESILLWSLSTYAKNQTKYAQLRQRPEFAHLSWLELRSPSQAKALLSGLAGFAALP